MCDKWKHVSVGACIWTIIFTIFCLCTVLVPFAVGPETETILTIKTLPLIGDGSFQEYVTPSLEGLKEILTLSDGGANFIGFFFSYNILFFYLIVIIDLIFAILLAIFRIKLMRKIFRGFSIAFGFIALMIAISFLAYIVGLVSFHFDNDIFSNFIHFFLTSGLLPSLVICILSFILAGKQFKWFSKPYKIYA